MLDAHSLNCEDQDPPPEEMEQGFRSSINEAGCDMLSPRASRHLEALLEIMAIDNGALPTSRSSGNDPSQDWPYLLDQLKALAELRAEVDLRIDATGRRAIRTGHVTFQQAGDAAGVTKQRAHQRFRALPSQIT